MSAEFCKNGSFLKTAKMNSSTSLPISITAHKIDLNLGRESDDLQTKSVLSIASEDPSIRYYTQNDDNLAQKKKQSSSDLSLVKSLSSKNKTSSQIINPFNSTVKDEGNLDLMKCIQSVEKRSDQSEETKSVNLSTTSESDLVHDSPSSINTKYYINYEGKLSLRTKVQTGRALDKFRNFGEKFEIVASVINEILLKLDSESKTNSIAGKKLLERSLSTFSTTTSHSSKYVSIKDIIVQKQKEKKGQQLKIKSNNGMASLIPKMGSIIRHLGLPITLSQSQPYLDVRAVYERVLSERDFATGKLLSRDNDLTETEDDYKQPLDKKEVSEEEEEDIVDGPFVSFSSKLLLYTVHGFYLSTHISSYFNYF